VFVLPGIIVDGGECGMSAVPSGHVCTFWFGDSRVSMVSNC